ncbi:MAG: glycosyltransferase family 2 protein [Thermodesulfobacteriota bacterium]
MTEKSVLSVIIVNRNTAELLVRCVQHLYSSRIGRDLQVIVVDNGSTDESVTAVRQRFPDVVVIEAGRNLGFAAANNVALREVRAEFVLLVNTDAMLDPDCAGKLTELMESRPVVGMAGPQLLNGDGTRQTSYEAVPTLATETLNRSLLKRLFPKRYPGKHRVLTEAEPVEALIGAVMIVRRAALDNLGGFDEDYFFFLEETDLAVRMRRAGRLVVHEPRARAVHLQGATAKTHQAAARIEFYRSRYLFFRKHYGTRVAGILKLAMVANLSMNVVVLGLVTASTLGLVRSVRQRLRVRAELWWWHLQGCPQGPGLPRD